MRKIIIALMSTAAIGAGALAGATPASANPALLIPWLFVAGAGGLTVGAAAATTAQPRGAQVVTSSGPAYPPTGYAAPAAYPPSAYPAPQVSAAEPGCQFSREWTANGWRNVEICN